MKFKHYQTKASFLTDLGDNKINNGDLCYIKDTQEIYTHGQYYRGCLSDYAQNDSTQPDYIKNRTHYVESVSTSSVWNQSGCSVGSGTTSPGGYPATFNITIGNKYNVTISQGSNSKTYEGLTAEYDGVFNGIALRKNWSDSTSMSDTSTDALLLVVQPSNVVLRSADIYGENCTVQVSEVTETVHKLDPKYLPDSVNQLDSITTSKSGKVTTVTFEQTNGTETQFQVNDGADGTNGKSAYQVAVDNGYSGTEAQWLASLKGADGVSLGEVELTQEVTQDTDKVPSDKAVYDEVAYPDVTYEHIQDLPEMTNYRSTNNAGIFFFYQEHNNYCSSGLIDVRNYGLITYSKFSTNTYTLIVLLDKEGTFIRTIKVGDVQSISRTDYPNLGYIVVRALANYYTNNTTVNLVLSQGQHLNVEVPQAKKNLNMLKHNMVRINTNTTFYEGDRLTNKTIVIMGNSMGGASNPLYGTIVLDYAATNWVSIKNSSNTALLNFQHGNKQSFSFILVFDASGNMNVYQNGVLKGTITYDKLPDTGWSLYIRYGTYLSHLSLINCALDEYVDVIENHGWENWLPDTIWASEAGYTFSGTTTKGSWIIPSGLSNNELIKTHITITNSTASEKTLGFSNMKCYSTGPFVVPANDSATFDLLIDVMTQKAIGIIGGTTDNISSVYEGYVVGFLWGIDYRYCHDGGFYNLNGLSYESATITLLANEAVPQVLASNGVGSAVGQIRVDANGNLQMYNGTTWKQINNS